MNTLQLLGIILGSNLLIEIVKQLFANKQVNAGTIKLKNEAGQIVIEGELKISDFYKKEWQELLKRYENLEKNFEIKEKEHKNCQQEIYKLQRQTQELQRQITLLKTQLNLG